MWIRRRKKRKFFHDLLNGKNLRFFTRNFFGFVCFNCSPENFSHPFSSHLHGETELTNTYFFAAPKKLCSLIGKRREKKLRKNFESLGWTFTSQHSTENIPKNSIPWGFYTARCFGDGKVFRNCECVCVRGNSSPTQPGSDESASKEFPRESPCAVCRNVPFSRACVRKFYNEAKKPPFGFHEILQFHEMT